MRKIDKQFVGSIFLMVLCLGLMIPPSAWAADPGVTDTTIKLGYIGDMTGPITAVTTPFRRGAAGYFEYVNKEKGGVHGRTIQYLPEDDKYQVSLAVTAFRKLVYRDKIFALVGLSGSSQSTALNPDIKKLGLPLFGPQQTIQSEIENPFIFNTISSYGSQAQMAVDYAMKQLAKQNQEPRIAAFTLKVESGYEWAQEAAKALTKKGKKLVGHILIDPRAVEAASQIKELKELNANYVLLHGAVPHAILYLKEANRYGFKAPVISMWGAFGEPVFKALDKEISGSFTGLWSFAPTWMPSKGMEELRYVSKKYGDPKDLEYFHHVHGYTTGRLFVEALNRAGKNLTRKSLIAAIHTMQNVDTEGLSAPVHFSADDSYGIKGSKLYGYDFEKKRVISLSDWMTP
ncbi:ABC transporter substrate-binding protein [Thermodesulfobacteriota bacterium]